MSAMVALKTTSIADADAYTDPTPTPYTDPDPTPHQHFGFVQGNYLDSGTGATSESVAFPSNQSSGDCNVVAVNCSIGVTISSVVDSARQLLFIGRRSSRKFQPGRAWSHSMSRQALRPDQTP